MPARSRQGSIAVLVVEDETLVRLDVVFALEEAGFKVYEAADADAAIRVLEEHRDIHVVFTDIDMPGSMDGLKLAHYVRGRWPPVKIIVTSGHAKIREEDLPPESVFLSKPYPVAQLTGKLREIVGQVRRGQVS